MLGKGADFSFFLGRNKPLSTKEQAEHPGLVEGIRVWAGLTGGRVLMWPTEAVSGSPSHRGEKQSLGNKMARGLRTNGRPVLQCPALFPGSVPVMP